MPKRKTDGGNIEMDIEMRARVKKRQDLEVER